MHRFIKQVLNKTLIGGVLSIFLFVHNFIMKYYLWIKKKDKSGRYTKEKILSICYFDDK